MPSIYQPRRPRASPLWQVVHHGWSEFLAQYESKHRSMLGPFDPRAEATVQAFMRCGDLASGFTRLECPDCGHERLLAFTCKKRHFCPACHQRRVRGTSQWIASSVCHPVPHPHLHLPPKGQQTVRYYGVYSNKTRGRPREATRAIHQADHPSPAKHLPEEINRAIQGELLLVEPPPKRSARLMRPLWRDLILQVWGGDPLQCPCCPGVMKVMRPMLKPGEVEFFLKLHGLWEGLVRLPRPPPPPFDIETLRRIAPPWRAIKEWISDQNPQLDWFNRPRKDREEYDQTADWQPKEVKLGDGRILLLDES